MSLLEAEFSSPSEGNPVDVVEQLAALNDWSFDRETEDEITIAIDGQWSDYHVSFSWMPHVEALHLACSFDLRIPERAKAEANTLLMMINEQVMIGHFDIWHKQGVIVFRHALLFPEGMEISARPCLAALSNALETCERFYQAFQFIVWAGKTAQEALSAAMFETAGEA